MRFKDIQVVLWCLGFLLLGEVALEARAYSRGWETILFSSSPPASRSAQESPYGPTAGFPFRSRIIAPGGARDSLRIWIASSSYGEDPYLPVETIFASRLEQRLHAAGVPAQVLNASRVGSTVLGGADRVRAEASAWLPHVVVLYEMSNDLHQISAILSGREAVAPTDNGEVQARPLLDGVLVWGERTTAYQTLKGAVTARLVLAREVPGDLGDGVDSLWTERLRVFVETVRSVGAVPVLSTFAVDSPDQGRPPDYAVWLARWNPYVSFDGWVRAVHRLNRVTHRFAAIESITVIDVAAAFQGRSGQYRDPVHFTRAGHETVAGALASGLMGLEQHRLRNGRRP